MYLDFILEDVCVSGAICVCVKVYVCMSVGVFVYICLEVLIWSSSVTHSCYSAGQPFILSFGLSLEFGVY